MSTFDLLILLLLIKMISANSSENGIVTNSTPFPTVPSPQSFFALPTIAPFGFQSFNQKSSNYNNFWPAFKNNTENNQTSNDNGLKFFFVVGAVPENGKIAAERLPTVTSMPTNLKTPTNRLDSSTSKPKANTNPANTCPIPKYTPDKTLSIICPANTPCKVNKTDSVLANSFIEVKCNKGYAPGNNFQRKTICLPDGTWLPDITLCIRTCPKLNPVNVDITCSNEEGKVNCSKRLPGGTKVTPRCKPEYKEENLDFGSITCRENGKWSAALPACVPVCGRLAATNVTALIHGGETAKFGELPWHIAVYEKPRSNTLICGGTIISQYVVLSAAHCFYDRAEGVKRNASDYVIAVGKFTRRYDILDSEVTKFYNIRNIYMNNFHGIVLRYQNDIAILETETKIIFNTYVIPACMNYAKPFVIPSGKRLKVAGWGLEESQMPSSELKIIELPYLSISECISKAPTELVDYFSTDKFCAGGEQGSQSKMVDTGDSGGGLLYLETSSVLYYLQGIVSYKSVTSTPLAAFTDVSQYSEWIRTIRDEIHGSRTEL